MFGHSSTCFYYYQNLFLVLFSIAVDCPRYLQRVAFSMFVHVNVVSITYVNLDFHLYSSDRPSNALHSRCLKQKLKTVSPYLHIYTDAIDARPPNVVPKPDAVVGRSR